LDILGVWNYLVQPQNSCKCGDSDMHVKAQGTSNFGGSWSMWRVREKGSFWALKFERNSQKVLKWAQHSII
jgi:hypothetical protein